MTEKDLLIQELRQEVARLKAQALQWTSVEDKLPSPFVSVLGHMTDAGPFPEVRECYSLGGKAFYFPALGDVHPVDKWAKIPEEV